MQIIVSYDPVRLWHVEDPCAMSNPVLSSGFEHWDEAVHWAISTPSLVLWDLEIEVEEVEEVVL